MKIIKWIVNKWKARKREMLRREIMIKDAVDRWEEMQKREQEAEKNGWPNPWFEHEDGDDTILYLS